MGSTPAIPAAEEDVTSPTNVGAAATATFERRRLAGSAAEQALALYRAIFVNSTEAIAIINADGFYLEQNAAHESLVGYSDDELRGKTPVIHLGETEFKSIADELARTGVCRRECQSRGKSGRLITIDLSAFAVRDTNGEPICYVGVKRDITREKQGAEELHRKFDELQAVYRMSNAVSRAGALEEIYEVALDELQRTVRADRASVLLFDDDRVMRFKAWRHLSPEYRRAVEGHSPWSPDETDPQPILVRDVNENPHLASFLPVFEREGIGALGFIPLVSGDRLLGKFMIYFDHAHEVSAPELQLAQSIASHIAFAIARKRDETALRESEQVQRRLYKEAQEANRAKSQFLATMSHELRTPLNAIGGYAELLQIGLRGPLTAEQLEDVNRIQRSQRHLLGLINDLLSFAKIESGHLELHIDRVLIGDAISSVEPLIQPQVTTKPLRYECVHGDASLACMADLDKLQQVLANLLSNAVKFTQAGGAVTVSWEASPDAVIVHVADTGPGIPSTKLEAIFEPFVQLGGSLTRVAEGTGLGLAISRELARAMGGDVTVASSFGAGSTFTLTLPRA